MSNGGRPTKFRQEFIKQAEKLCALGATDAEMADFFEVSKSTLNKWKCSIAEFSDSIKTAKEIADRRVERSLYERAVGYDHPDTKMFSYEGAIIEKEYTKHIPPDPTSMIFWLKNRNPEQWRDKQELGGTIVTEIKRIIVDPAKEE